MTSQWPIGFAVIASSRICPVDSGSKLLRDDYDNVPQPGFIGKRESSTGIVLIGQNAGTRRRMTADRDKRYMNALRELRDRPSAVSWDTFWSEMSTFVPHWPLHGRHFPLAECNLEIDQIAYTNIVRCRTKAN